MDWDGNKTINLNKIVGSLNPLLEPLKTTIINKFKKWCHKRKEEAMSYDSDTFGLII